MTLDDTEAENLRLKAALEGQNYLLNSYELLETVTDKCEAVATQIEGIVLENS